MTFDLITVSLLVIAFITGFQKGVLQIFALVLALFSAFLLMTWVLPYLTDFFYASFPYEYHSFYTGTVILLFFIILIISFIMIRVLWRKEPTDRKILLQKTLGGLTMALLMVASISTITVFLKRSKIISSEAITQSRAATYLEPVERWSIDLLDSIDRNARHVKKRSDRAKQEQGLGKQEG